MGEKLVQIILTGFLLRITIFYQLVIYSHRSMSLSKMYSSKTKLVKYYYCKLEILDELKAYCLKKHNATKRVVGEASVSSYFGLPAKKKSKPDDPASSPIPSEMLLSSGGRVTPEDNILK